MRWPLRNQILTRMLVLLVITVSCFTYASIRSVISTNREAEVERAQRIVELMTTSRFPLTASVLENMKLLSGADFVFVEEVQGTVSKTAGAPSELPKGPIQENESREQSVPTKINSNGKPFYHTAVSRIGDINRSSATGILHVFVPTQSERSVWWQASKSPLTIALFVLPLALLLSLALANQVTRPLASLNQQVQRIAEGKTTNNEIQAIPEARLDDEIRDLNISINEMAVKLQDHDIQLRKNERLRTMVQFGSGIAHHLGNSATGCKMAFELLAVEEQQITDSENYQVAIRQLGLMDNYIKKFLLLSRTPESDTVGPVEELALSDVLENVIFLVRPSAEHLGVDLKVQTNCDETKIRMSEEDGQQLMMNLIVNAIRAASERVEPLNTKTEGLVSVKLMVNNGKVQFSVTDNGTGPPENITDSLFEPFVTGSKEGTGLGLSLVRKISQRANGKTYWRRENNLTTFSFEVDNLQQTRIE